VLRVADIVNDVIQPAVVNHDLTLNYRTVGQSL